MRHRWPLPVPVLPLLVVLGGLVVGPVPPAHACSVVGARTVRVPVSQATDEDRRWAISSRSGPDHLEVVQPRPLPPGGVLFEGTAVATGPRPPRRADRAAVGAPTWTFRVEQVLWGEVAPEVVVVGAAPVGPGAPAPCPFSGPSYQVGHRHQVVAVPDPATGEWLGITGRYVALAPGPASISPRPDPVPRQQGAVVQWIVVTFLVQVGVLGVVLTAAALYLRARELDLEERELALRARELALRERRAGSGLGPGEPPAAQ